MATANSSAIGTLHRKTRQDLGPLGRVGGGSLWEPRTGLLARRRHDIRHLERHRLPGSLPFHLLVIPRRNRQQRHRPVK